MIVANVSPWTAALRSRNCSSVTLAPKAMIASMAAESMTNEPRIDGVSLAMDSSLSRCASSSAKASTTSASLNTMRICAGELVSYTGTVTQPMDMMAMSRATHSQRVCAMIAMDSPARAPHPISPLAMATTLSRNSVAEKVCQMPLASL